MQLGIKQAGLAPQDSEAEGVAWPPGAGRSRPRGAWGGGHPPLFPPTRPSVLKPGASPPAWHSTHLLTRARKRPEEAVPRGSRQWPGPASRRHACGKGRCVQTGCGAWCPDGP